MRFLKSGRKAGSVSGGRQWWRPRLVMLLLAIVMVPLAMAGQMLLGDLRELNSDRAVAQNFVPQAELRLATIRLRASLADERTWTFVRLGLEGFGLDSESFDGMAEAFVRNQQDEARQHTDDHIAQLPGFGARLQTVRAMAADPNVSVVTVDDHYVELIAEVTALGEQTAANLERAALRRSDATDLLRTLALVEATAAAELSGDAIFVSYITSRFVDPLDVTASDTNDYVAGLVGETHDAQSEIRALVEYRHEYDQANAEMDRYLVSGEVLDLVEAIRSAEFEQTLLVSADEQISAGFSTGAAIDNSATFGTDLEDLAKVMNFITAATTSKVAWVELTDAIGEDLEQEAHRLGQVSLAEISSTQTRAIVLAALTLLVAVTGAGLIIRSVRRLDRSAQALRDGVSEEIRPCGPYEFHSAGLALAEAGANIQLIQRQAAALAAGNLSHPDLSKVAPGELGLELKVAVDDLARSIRRREDATSRAAWEAGHDSLTGLPNRAAALEKLGKARTDGLSGGGLVLIDLDRFNEINETFGHSAGDEVLVEIADRLQTADRVVDTVCRIGGDEFLVVLGGLVNERQAMAIADRFVESARRVITLSSGEAVRVAVCAGISMNKTGTSPSEVLQNAEFALHEAKNTGGDQIISCSKDLLESIRKVNGLVADLTTAVTDGQLRLQYEPVVDSFGAPKSLKTLIGWEHPDRGLLTSDDFMVVAERTELIVNIGRWMLGAVSEQIAQWSETSPMMDGVTVVVEISGRHLHTTSFVDDVLTPLSQSSVDPRRLAIEITESSLMDNVDRVCDSLTAVRAAGVRTIIDGSGTGNAGMSQLRHVPFDMVKLDQALVSRVADRSGGDPALVQLVVDVAHEFGAEVIVEKIETSSHAKDMVDIHVDALQGSFFSPPVAPQEVPDRLAQLVRRARLGSNSGWCLRRPEPLGEPATGTGSVTGICW